MKSDYESRRRRSHELSERASTVMPGGDTRSVTYFEPYPTFMASGSGCFIQDVDGNTYTDFLNNYTVLVLGHAHPQVVDAVVERVKKGTVFPAPAEEQILLAESIKRRVKSCDLVRFCNSGSEANIQAIRVARAHTKRRKVVKPYGGYHGGFDISDFLIIPFNDQEKAEDVIRKNKDDIACVIVEPVLGMGMIPAERDFLQVLRELTLDFDIVFVLDEVVTFRLDMGGAQTLYKITPDITTFGKIIGGGFPVGAFGGNEDLMILFSPQREKFIPHSGSFNGNPVTMTAGIETLKLLDSQAIEELNKRGDLLRSNLNKIMEDMSVSVSGTGSLLHFHWAESPALNAEEFERQNRAWFSKLHMLMLMEGVYMAPRGMFNLSRALGEPELDMFVKSAKRVIPRIK
ncbi:MAG: aspartate aminotransferase family protein [Theionarchaea archaeon]|nr:aspartate aminotransferase family protein [Theionarchaea archaeon]